MGTGRISNPSGANTCAGPCRTNIDNEKDTLDDHSECWVQKAFSGGAAIRAGQRRSELASRNRQAARFG